MRGRVLHLQQEAGDASQSAKEAASAASTANTKALGAKGKADKAGAIANTAESTATAATTAAEDLDKRIASAITQLEVERQHRLELEKSLAPRVVGLETYTDGTTNVDSIKKFAGTVFNLQYIQDAEAGRAAADIRMLLIAAGWKEGTIQPTSETGIGSGILLETYSSARRPTDMRAVMAGTQLSVGLISFFEYGWESSFGARESVIPYEILIIMGFKPNPYFAPPELKAAQARIRKKIPEPPAKQVQSIVFPE